MKHNLLTIVAAILLTATSSCNHSEKNATVTNRTSPLVTFCNNVNYNDTATIHNEKKMKKLVAGIVRLQLVADSTMARQGLTTFFNGLRNDEEALSLAIGLADHYLYNPGSPLRNEEKYIEFLSILLDVDSIPDIVKNVATDRLRIASLNRTGTRANDFSFEKPDGTRRALYDISAPLTLIVFYNPECGPCTKILAEIAANPIVNAAIDDGRLAVVAIYAEGDKTVWRNNLSELPSNWTIGYDISDILNNDIYDLPAMPTLYLLDADKRVLLKDPDHRIIDKYLQRHED